MQMLVMTEMAQPVSAKVDVMALKLGHNLTRGQYP
jgi:hypothetical protein